MFRSIIVFTETVNTDMIFLLRFDTIQLVLQMKTSEADSLAVLEYETDIF